MFSLADPAPALPRGWPPIYEPSTVIGQTRYLTLLNSPGSVRVVYEFYAAEPGRGGWITTSRNVSDTSAAFVGHHGPHGATISIRKTGTGTAVSIGSY